MGQQSHHPEAGSPELPPLPTRLSRRRILAMLAAAACSGCGLAAAADSAPRAGPAEFLRAVSAGNRSAVASMLNLDASLVRAIDNQGRSAFVLAHLSGHRAIAQLLRDRGLELDIVEAVIAADWDRVEALASAQPELLNQAHPIGGNVLYASALTGGGEQYRLRSLGAQSDGRPAGGSGYTPARAAMNCRDPIGAWLAATDLLSNGADPNAAQAKGDSVLHGAVSASDLRLVRLVMRKGGALHARDSEGSTPLDRALALEWEAGVELLRDAASVARDYRGSRFAFNVSREPFVHQPLSVGMAAQNQITGVSHFNPARVRELLAQDPRLVHAISSDAELAIEACGHTGQREAIAIHLDHGAPLSLPTAISLGDLPHARWLLEQDRRLINERGPHDFPVMWYPAIGGGSVEAAALLLAFGADLEQESGGETALHAAAARGHLDLIRFLLEQGADSQALSYRQDRKGLTPRQLALSRRQDAAAALLGELA